MSLFAPRRDVPLAPRTTLELGGAAAHFVSVEDASTLTEAFAWARQKKHAIAILGGGSNLLIPDEGVPGLVLAVQTRGLTVTDANEAAVQVQVAAGVPWDELVAWSIDEGLGGIECLSGIPGTAGAAPVQNIGAYGQELSSTLIAVELFDLALGITLTWSAAECAFGYRSSRLKAAGGRFVVTSISLRLRRATSAPIAHEELGRLIGATHASPEELRRGVLELRQRKSMVLRPDDPFRRSAGSFFMNPFVTPEHASELSQRYAGAMPCWPASGGRVKLSAAWLIEQAGFPRGTRRGAVGLSGVHALALVHYGGGTTSELLRFADELVAAVQSRFAVRLEREPVILQGYQATPEANP